MTPEDVPELEARKVRAAVTQALAAAADRILRRPAIGSPTSGSA